MILRCGIALVAEKEQVPNSCITKDFKIIGAPGTLDHFKIMNRETLLLCSEEESGMDIFEKWLCTLITGPVHYMIDLVTREHVYFDFAGEWNEERENVSVRTGF